MEPKLRGDSSIESLPHLSQSSGSSAPRLDAAAAMPEDLHACSDSARSEAGKVRFMCSYGGRIMPRPHDSQLRYVGGETRILVVNRSITLADLMGKLTRLCGGSVQLKYQLPNEDMDSLVSVLIDEDLESMMEEYDRLEVRDAASARLRLFLFPAKSYSASAVDLAAYDARNAEQRFVDAVNGIARRQQSLPASQTQLPDYLFGLDVSQKLDSAPSKMNTAPLLRAGRCFLLQDGLLASDHQLPLQNHSYSNIPVAKDPSHKRQFTQLDPLIYFSSQASIPVVDHFVEAGFEPINQFPPVIPVDTHASEKLPISELIALPRILQKKPESDSISGLNLASDSEDLHESAKGSIATAQIEEKSQLKVSSTQTTQAASKSAEFPGESNVAEANSDSYKAQIQHLVKISHDPSALYSNEHEPTPSSPQKIVKFVSDEANDREGSGFQGQLKEVSGGRSEQYLHKEGIYISFEDSDNPLRSTITSQQTNNPQQNLQNFQHHAAIHPWQGEADQLRLQQQSRAAAAAFLHPSQSNPRAAGSAPLLLRAHAHRQCLGAPQPTNLHRQLSAAAPYSELPQHQQQQHQHQHQHQQQQQHPVCIMSGQLSTGRVDQPTTRLSRVQSPSRFRDRSPSTSIQAHWINPEATETRQQLLRTAYTSQHPSPRSAAAPPPQHDHYPDPTKHAALSDPSASSHFPLMLNTDSQLKHYPDHINSPESNPFSADNVRAAGHVNDPSILDSHAYQAAAYLHQTNEQQAGSTDQPHPRHVQLIHQVMRT